MQPALVSCPADSLHKRLPNETSEPTFDSDHYADYLRDTTLELGPVFGGQANLRGSQWKVDIADIGGNTDGPAKSTLNNLSSSARLTGFVPKHRLT